MSNVRICGINYLDDDYLNARSVSSENSSYPDDNLYDNNRRSKVWRSTGNYVVASTNKVIIFEETAGADLTATLTEGTYTATTLCAEVKAALEAAGASTYTVTFSSTTFKFTIASDGGGGGGILDIEWDHASTTAEDLLGFSSAAEDTGALTYTADNIRIHTEEWIKWDLGTTYNPEAFIAVGLRDAGIALTDSATITLQGNETDAWTSPSYSQAITYDEEALSYFDSDGLHSGALRYWRLKIVDKANPNGYVELAAVYLGESFEPTRGAVQFPFSGQILDSTITQYSEDGQSYSDLGSQLCSFSVEFFGLTIAEKEELEDIFADVGTGNPLFISFDPLEAFSSAESKYIKLVKITDPFAYQLVSPGVFSASMTFREEI